MLTQDQIRIFHDQGCVIVEGFFDDRDIAAMRSELGRLRNAGAGRNVATDGDSETESKTKVNYQIIPLNTVSNLFRAFPFQEKVIDAVTGCIGRPFVRQLDQVFIKPAGHGVGTDWHQDNAYFRIADPTRAVGMWTALHDADRANGTLELIPRSHLSALPHERDPGSSHHIHCIVEDEIRILRVEVEAGGVVFFNYGIAHRTRPNPTDQERAGLAFHFLRTDFIRQGKSTESYVHVTGDRATNGRKEYGVDLSGAWDLEVEKVLASVR